MPGVYDSLKRLLVFKKSTTATLEDYINQERQFSSNTISAPNPPLTAAEQAHEDKHAAVWNEKNINCTFGRDSEGNPFTAPDLDDISAWVTRENITKAQFLEQYLKVVTAPLPGIRLGKTDSIKQKILTGVITTTEELWQAYV